MSTDYLTDFVTAVGTGKVPNSEAMEAAATAIGGMLAFADYHRRRSLGVSEDVAEAQARNVGAAHRLVGRILDMLQRPIAGGEYHSVLVGGTELDWLANLLERTLKDPKGKRIELVPTRSGPCRTDRQRDREIYAASIRDDSGISEDMAARMVAHHTAVLDREPFLEESISRDTLNKELLPAGRKALARRKPI